MERHDKPPFAIWVIGAIIAFITLYSVYLTWDAIIHPEDEPGMEAFFPYAIPPPPGLWISLMVPAGVVILSLLFSRLRLAIPLALAYIVVGCSELVLHLRQLPDFEWTPRPEGIWSLISDTLIAPQWQAYVFFVLVVAGCYFLLAEYTPSRTWFQLRDDGAVRARRSLPAILVAAALSFLALMLLTNFPLVTHVLLNFYAYPEWSWHVDSIDRYLPIAAASAILLFPFALRAFVNESGVKLCFADQRLAFLSAKWSRTRRVDIVEYEGKKNAVINAWWSFIPISFALKAKHYENGDDLVNETANQAREAGVPVVPWTVWPVAKLLAVLFFCAGSFFFIYSRYLQNHSWAEYARADDFPLTRFADLAAPTTYALLYLASLTCLCAAAGFLSASERAGPRPILFAVYVILLTSLALDPIMHWLVWAAIYSILSAQLVPLGPPVNVSVPSLEEWDRAFSILWWSPVIAGIAYILAIVLVSRKAATADDALRIQHPADATPAPPTRPIANRDTPLLPRVRTENL